MSTPTTLQIRDYAWMAQASYLDFRTVAPYNATALATRLQNDTFYEVYRFAEAQANAFTDATTGFSLVNQTPDQTSGFSATLFKGNAGGYTIAVRGTDPKNQIIEDLVDADALGVVLQGRASFQVYDAYRYYKELSSATGKVTYSAGELAAMASLLVTASDKLESVALFPPSVQSLVRSWTNSLTFESRVQSMIATIRPILNSDDGLNAIPAGESVNFTGHSLGGHVAALLAEMVGTFQGKDKVGDIVTYNAPGTNALSNEVANWFGINTTVQSGVLGSKHLAIYSEGGVSVTAGLGQINGTRQSSFIETGVSVPNHSIVKLSDVYAVKNIYATLSPGTSDARMDSFFKAVSNQFPDSLEKALDSIRKVAGLSGSTIQDGRKSLYDNIKILTESEAFKALKGKVTLFLADSTLSTKAPTDFAAFLSLNALSPVVVSTTDASALAALKVANPGLAAAWTADQSARLAGDTSKVFAYSDNWYADRSNLLTDLVYRNDRLNGGAGNDMLLGGAGTDTYQFFGGDGFDTIVDSDGLGAITFSGVALVGGSATQGASKVWQSADKKTTFIQRGTDLVISQTPSGPGSSPGSVTVKNWSNGQLGITLSDSVGASAPAVQKGLSTDSGDGSHTHVVNLNAAQYAGYSSFMVTGTDAAEDQDYIFVGGGNWDLVLGDSARATVLTPISHKWINCHIQRSQSSLRKSRRTINQFNF